METQSASPALVAEIAALRKSPRETLVVQLCEFEGRTFLDLRIFDIASGPRPRPTKRGVALRPQLIPEMIAALHAAEAKARELGILDGRAR